MTTTPVTTQRLAALRDEINGRLITPGDADYDATRAIALGGIDRHPALIVRVADHADVARVVLLARETGLELAVRGGGHSAAGHGVTEGGIVLDLRDLQRLDVDLEGGTAWADAGLTAGQVTTALDKHDLAVGFGDTGSVGIGGITTGGGIGYLVRKHGLTIDSLLAADVVTADGERLRTAADHHPDLFWGIRGGGGNLGVVTRFQFRLQPIGEVVGGMLMVPATADSIAGFMEAAAAAPEELSAIGNVMPAPPMPFVPEEHHGSLVLMALIVHAGDQEAGLRAMKPFRALGTPVVDMLRPMRYPEIYFPEPPLQGPPPIFVQRTFFLDRFEPPMAGTIIEGLASTDSPMRAVQLRVLGGAAGRVANDATAYGHRERPILAVAVNLATGPGDVERRVAWAQRLMADLRGETRGAYANFVGDEGTERVHEAYPDATWRRLAQLKRRYDPENLFHRNQNVPPAGATATRRGSRRD